MGSEPGSDPELAGDDWHQRPQHWQYDHNCYENYEREWNTDFYVINEAVTARTHDEDIRRM